MTGKLRKKLKTASRRRMNREKVSSRKKDRLQALKEGLATNKEENKAIMAFNEAARVAGKVQLDENGKPIIDKVTMKEIGGLMVRLPDTGKKKKNLTRKQMNRQIKNVTRGMADSTRLDKKWENKKKRVKHRAQVRNTDLQN
jgi:hypothetical protein